MKIRLLVPFFLLAGAALAQNTPEVRTGDGWRMIQESASPDGRYALAWGQKGKSQPKLEPGTNFAAGFDQRTNMLNYVVDLTNDSIIGETSGNHFGDLSYYNHESTQAAWSKHNRYVTQTMSWKWHSEVSVLYEIINGKNLSKGTDLIEPAWKAAYQKVKGKPRFQKFKEEDFEVIIANTTFTEKKEQTQLTIVIWGQTGKFEGDVSFEAVITFRVLPTTGTSEPSLELVETKLVEE